MDRIPYDQLVPGHLYQCQSTRRGIKVALYVGNGRYLYVNADTYFLNATVESALDVQADSITGIIIPLWNVEADSIVIGITPLGAIEEAPKWTNWEKGAVLDEPDDAEARIPNNLLLYYLAFSAGKMAAKT